MKVSEYIRKQQKVGFFKTYLSGAIRAAVIAFLLLFQFGIVFGLSYWIYTGFYVYYGILILSVFVIIGLVNKRTNSSFKIGWLVIITLIPVAGLMMYVLWGANRSNRIKKRNLRHIEYSYRFLNECEDVKESFGDKASNRYKMVEYMEKNHFKLFDHNRVNYFSFGKEAFDSIERDMKNAEKFIFIDFFIVADGVLWQRIREILIDRAKHGVEIKFLYDDYGSMFRTKKALWKELEEHGIDTAEFNPIGKYLDKLYLNYRSHQKIVVIDGRVGYTGGFNLADEYTNELERFGVWKDNGIRIEGEGVYGLTCAFLQMWCMTKEKDIEDYTKYRFDFSEDELSKLDKQCFCQIVSDGPANNPSNPIADIIMQMIYNSTKYLYITTPYLLLEDDIENALIIAAQSGIDVRIITPGIPDKKMIYHLTRYNYRNLINNGIRIFEYTPGFIHAKTYISDGYGMIGTMNLDFRSLYLHYECGAFVWNKDAIEKIREDLLLTMEECHEVTAEEFAKRPWYIKCIEPFFNLFSSLM